LWVKFISSKTGKETTWQSKPCFGFSSSEYHGIPSYFRQGYDIARIGFELGMPKEYMHTIPEFLGYMEEAFNSVEGVSYNYTLDLEPKDQPNNCTGYYTYDVDLKNMGNITWYYMGGILRHFANSPRVIINFCRLAKMKFGEGTILTHFGFHNTLVLAHSLRMEENEKDFIYLKFESFMYDYFKKFNNLDISYYLKDNLQISTAPNYRENAKGERRMIDDSYYSINDTSPSNYTIVRNGQRGIVSMGIWWTEGMDEKLLTDLFIERK
jgi:hypothetical protein